MIYNIVEVTALNATKEQWKYDGDERVWVGKYKNSQNTLHWHNDCELIYAECGALDVVAGGVCYRLNAGGAMFIQSGMLHRINAVEPNTVLLTIIFDYKIISDFANSIELSSPVLTKDYGIPKTYARLLSALKGQAPLYIYETAAEVNRLTLDIFKTEPTEQKRTSSPTDAKIKALLSDIQNRYDSYTLLDAAEFMGMNASYLSRFFTEKTGMHFTKYVNCVRIENAVEMLSCGDYNVTEVAVKCGFGTIRNFNRMFKLLTGYSPSHLPRGYEFLPTATDDGKTVNPTLSGCELIECSSKK